MSKASRGLESVELIEANGTLLNTLKLGTGSPVIMVHGLFTGSLASWLFTCAPALARSHEVLIYDLRGHGRSARPRSGYDLATLGRDLDALSRRAFGERPFALVGHSYGAMISACFAAISPGRVTKLALVDAPIDPSPLAGLGGPQVWHWMDGPGTEIQPEQATQATQGRSAAAPGRSPGRRKKAAVNMLLNETEILEELRSQDRIPDTTFARVAVPTLCVYGDRSPYLAAGRRLASVLPDARLVVLPAGHMVHLDATQQLTAELQGLIDGDDGGDGNA